MWHDGTYSDKKWTEKWEKWIMWIWDNHKIK